MGFIKKKFLVLTSLALVVGTFAVGGIKNTSEVEAAISSTPATEIVDGGTYIVEGDTGNFLGAHTGSYFSRVTDEKSALNLSFELLSDSSYYITYMEDNVKKYFSYTGNKNKIQEVTSPTQNAKWDISFQDSKVNITNKAITGRKLQYNKSEPRFACYTSSQTLLTLYKVIGTYTVTYDANGGECSITSEEIEDGKQASLPIPTKEGFTFLGWTKTLNGDDFVESSYTPVGSVTLYAKWANNALTSTIENLNKVESYMSYGYNYNFKEGNMTFTPVTDINTDLNGKSVVLVAKYGENYMALSSNSGENNAKSVDLVNGVITNMSELSQDILWELSGSVTEGYSLKNNNYYLNASTTSTTISTDSVDEVNASKFVIYDFGSYKSFSLKEEPEAGKEARALLLNNSSTFKNYAVSNFGGSNYTNEIYIYMVDGVADEYSNVEFRIKSGIKDTLAGTTLPEGAEYGIAVSTDASEQLFPIDNEYVLTNDSASEQDPNKYVVISLGDVINNIERATTEFTTRAYVKFEGVTYYSELAKTYSIASLTKTYKEQGVTQVNNLYDLLSEKGCYVA